MGFTVKQVAEMSGVSVRTLRFYDETGLLKPARVAANGYRIYEEPQLLTLQQILFYRELGFELKAIGEILGRADFERIAALESHPGAARTEACADADLDRDHRPHDRTFERSEGDEERGAVRGVYGGGGAGPVRRGNPVG